MVVTEAMPFGTDPVTPLPHAATKSAAQKRHPIESSRGKSWRGENSFFSDSIVIFLQRESPERTSLQGGISSIQGLGDERNNEAGNT
jgi:hypothetical protein